jgi:hypothetical protein
MTTFTVTVRTLGSTIIATYQAIGTDSASVHMAALDRFGPCGVSVKPA